nr:hypothetical protein [Bradyrhizobium guangdongense]
MDARFQNSMILPDQLLARIAADRAEIVVHVVDHALHVRDRDDHGLIDGILLLDQLLHRFIGPDLGQPLAGDIPMHLDQAAAGHRMARDRDEPAIAEFVDRRRRIVKPMDGVDDALRKAALGPPCFDDLAQPRSGFDVSARQAVHARKLLVAGDDPQVRREHTKAGGHALDGAVQHSGRLRPVRRCQYPDKPGAQQRDIGGQGPRTDLHDDRRGKQQHEARQTADSLRTT